MARFTSALITCAIAIAFVSAQETSTPSCVIDTPQASMEVIQVGKPLTVTFTGCIGTNKSVMLRYGDPTNLQTSKAPACANVNLSVGKCTFTPKKAGNYALSVQSDGATEPSYTAFFTIAPEPKADAAKSAMNTATSTDKALVPASAKGVAPASAKGVAPASAKGVAPASAKGVAPASAKGVAPASAKGVAPAFAKGVAPASAKGVAPASAKGVAPASAKGIAPAKGVAPASAKVPAPASAKGVAPASAKSVAPASAKVPAPASAKVPAPASAKGPAPASAKGPTPNSPTRPAPVHAGKPPQPMATKPEIKMVPATSKAEAIRKAYNKRALYDIAAFAL